MYYFHSFQEVCKARLFLLHHREENPSFSGTKRLASDLLEDWFLNYGSRVLNRFKHCCPSHHTRFITNIRDFQRWKFWGWVKSHGRKSGDERQPHPGRCGQGETQPHGLRPHVTSLETRGAGLPAPGHSGTFPALPDVLPTPPPENINLQRNLQGRKIHILSGM